MVGIGRDLWWLPGPTQAHRGPPLAGLPDADGFQASPLSQACKDTAVSTVLFVQDGLVKRAPPHLFIAVYSTNYNCHDPIS